MISVRAEKRASNKTISSLSEALDMLPIGIEDKAAAEENGEPEVRVPGTGQEIRDLGGKCDWRCGFGAVD